MSNSNTNDAYYACLEKCLFEPLFAQYSSCYKLDIACACGHGVWDQIYGCTQGSCGAYKSQISSSALSYCTAASQIPKASAQTVTVAVNGGGSNSYIYYTYTSTSVSYATTTVTSVPTNGASVSRTTVTVTDTGTGTGTAIAATATPSNTNSVECDSSALGTGAVAGIAAGCLLIGAAIALIAACLFFRRRRNKKSREYIPEIQQPTIARRPVGSGPSAAPLLNQPMQQTAFMSNNSPPRSMNGPVHGVPTLVGQNSNDRLGSPAPTYSSDPKYNEPRYQPLKSSGAMYADQSVVEHDGRERGYWQNR